MRHEVPGAEAADLFLDDRRHVDVAGGAPAVGQQGSHGMNLRGERSLDVNRAAPPTHPTSPPQTWFVDAEVREVGGAIRYFAEFSSS